MAVVDIFLNRGWLPASGCTTKQSLELFHWLSATSPTLKLLTPVEAPKENEQHLGASHRKQSTIRAISSRFKHRNVWSSQAWIWTNHHKKKRYEPHMKTKSCWGSPAVMMNRFPLDDVATRNDLGHLWLDRYRGQWSHLEARKKLTCLNSIVVISCCYSWLLYYWFKSCLVNEGEVSKMKSCEMMHRWQFTVNLPHLVLRVTVVHLRDEPISHCNA